MAKNLTDATVKKTLPHATKRLEIPDGANGLYLVVQPLPSGKKTWAVRFRVEGKPAKMTLGDLDTFSLKEARDAAKAIMQKVASGENPARERVAAKRRSIDGEGTITALARQFIARHAQRNNRSWREPMRQLGFAHAAGEDRSDDAKTFVVRPGSFLALHGHRLPSDIRRADILAYIDDIVDSGKPIAANRTLAAIKKFFAWLVERDLLAASPADRVKAPSEERARDRVLTDAELAAVMREADAMGWPLGPMLKVLALTGQRRNEVAGMRWSEIDREKALWIIPGDRAKNGSTHSVPLADEVMAILEAAPSINRSDLVFTTTGRTPISGFSRMKAALDKRLGDAISEDWRIHDLRRTAATGMARLGVPIPVVEKTLNHLSGSFAGIVAVYQRHSYDDEKRAALAAWARFLVALGTEQPANVVPLRERK